MVPCLKQKTRCVIIREDGRKYEATNLCNIDGQKECPRIIAKCKTGEGYELCGSTHAEQNVAILAQESKDIPGEAFLYGHTWICKSCQDALISVNVRTFHIMEELQDELDEEYDCPVHGKIGGLGGDCPRC